MAYIVAKVLVCLLIVGNVAALIAQPSWSSRNQHAQNLQNKHYSSMQNQHALNTSNSTVANHTCPKFSVWDETSKQCFHCHSQNFTLQMDNESGKWQCLCNSPYKLTTKASGQQTCQKPPVNRTCPEFAAWDEPSQQCLHCPLLHFTLEKNTATSQWQCLCKSPYKLTAKASGQKVCSL